MELTLDQLKAIIAPTKYSDEKLNEITDALNQTFSRYQIDNELRICHFLAQVLHESVAFLYTEEIWGPTAAQLKYEGRADLGNTSPGDGYKFRGRGWIQLTGRSNYAKASEAFGQDYVGNPDVLKDYPMAAIISGWFWDTHGLNSHADSDDVMTITHIINGGYNGIDSRKTWLAKAKRVIMAPPVFVTDTKAGKVIASKLNIRVNPSVDAKTVTDPLDQNTPLTVIDEQDGWYKVKTEIIGWVKKEYVQLNS